LRHLALGCSFVASLSILTGFAFPDSKTDPRDSYIDAAVFDDSLLLLRGNGELEARSLESLHPLPESALLTEQRFLRIESAGNGFVALSGEGGLFVASKEEPRWNPLLSDFEIDTEGMVEFVTTTNGPYVIYRDRVINPLTGRTYLPPILRGPIPSSLAFASIVRGIGPRVWIGTSQGEWGGHLAILDTETGAWSTYYDSLGYPTGIDRLGKDDVVVTWAMSHFMASSRLRVHNAHAEIVREYRRRNDSYYQSALSTSHGVSLVVVDRQYVYKMVEDEAVAEHDLGTLTYPNEPWAIGVRPAVLDLFESKTGALVVILRDAKIRAVRRLGPVEHPQGRPAKPLIIDGVEY